MQTQRRKREGEELVEREGGYFLSVGMEGGGERWHAALQGVSECAGTGSCLLSGGLWCGSSGEPEWNLKHSKDWCW